MKRAWKGSRRSRRGGVLIACLAVVMTMATMSAMLLQFEASRARAQLFGADQKRALNLAEAGLSEAYYGLTIGLKGGVGSLESPAVLGDGLFWVEAEHLENGLISLKSTGMCGSGRATLGLVVRREPISVASLGIMGGDRVAVGNRAKVDSYDSRVSLSPTADAPDSSAFRLQSNGDITLGNLTRVEGDATPGPNGSVLLGSGATVTGATTPSNAPVTLPAIDIPELTPEAFGSPLVPTELEISGKEASYASIRIGPGSKLTIRGPSTLAIDEFSVQDLGSLVLDTSTGPITLYVRNWLDLAPLANVTFTKRDPKLLSLLVSASQTADRNGDLIPDAPVRVGYSGLFYGALYAPYGRVALANGFELFGTVAAKELTLGANSKVHFDAALESESNGDASSVSKLSWRVIDVPTEVARTLAPDPFRALNVDADALDKPAEAHEPATYRLLIKYLDLSLTERTYRGPESAFDWGQVKQVLRILREEM